MIEFIIFLIAALGWCIYKLIKHKRDELLSRQVYWVCSKSDCIRYNLPLKIHFRNAQTKSSVQEQYKIQSEEEWYTVERILEEYQRDLMYAFFEKRTYPIKEKLTSNENQDISYFMFSLYVFLCNHKADHEFIGEKMHTKTISYERYGTWGMPLFSAVYEISDFAFVFHKMQYISYMFAKNNDLLRNLVPAWNEENLKEVLDKKQIWISRI